MADPLDEVLRLVAEGRLTAEEAAPVLDALQAGRADELDDDTATTPDEPPANDRPRAVRIEVSEGGHRVVNLRVPIARSFTLSRAAAAHRLIERGHLLGKVVLSI